MQIVLDLVASTETTTRADVARTTGLTRATISTIVGELIDDGLVVEVGRGQSEGGKPPTLISLNKDGRHLIAVDLSASPFSGRIVNLAGQPIGETMTADPSGDHQADLNTLIARLAATTNRPVVGVSVASPGVITDDGVVVEASNLDWHNHRLASLTEAACGLPVTVVNDAQAAAVTAYARLVAELSEGDRPPSDLLLIQIGGAGVGAGIILGGRIHLGSHRAAGEIGHSVLDPEGRRCHCGNRGCLETVASASAIYSRFANKKVGAARWDLERAKAKFGCETVEAALVEAGQAIGSTLGILINALDISLLVISMQSERAAESVARAVDQTLTPRVLPALRPDLQVTAVGGNDLSLLGAAAVVLNDRFGLSWLMPATS